MPPDPCAHPADRVKWRKWLPSMGRGVRFRQQCLDCLAGIGPKDTRPLDLPDEVDPGALLMAKVDHRKKGRTGLGGRGNSRSRELQRFYRSPQWRGRGGIRDRVLERDHNRCKCGARAREVAHLFYRESVWDTRAEDCVASCGACNLEEKSLRITRRVFGT